MSPDPAPERRRLPLLDLGRQHQELRGEIAEAIDRVVGAGAFIGGREVERFETEFAEYCGAGHCIGVANGTDALTLALRALQIGPGDEVITVPFTFAGTVEAIDLVGATPVLVDIDPRDYTIDVTAAARALERPRVKALIAVHLYGQPADLGALIPLARERRVAVVEDAAQAHGARLLLADGWRRAGSIGDLGCFSFYPSKNLGAMGDAGAVTTGDAELARRVRLLANHGQEKKYEHLLRGGTNSRLDALQAAVLRVKLRALDRWNAARRQAAHRYGELLRDTTAGVPQERAGAESVYHQYAVRVADRARVQASLDEEGIDTALHYPRPVHLQPAYAGLGLGAGAFPAAEAASAEVLSLPLFPHIGVEDQRRVAAAVRRATAGR